MKKRPDFFIVGAAKAGTTSLYYYLQEHPEIYMSPVKETNYFSRDEIRRQGLYQGEENIVSLKDYEEQFAGVTGEKAIGEASVSYLFYESVPTKIKEFNPASRIIIVLRNPVDRAFSHYLMDKRLGFVNLSLEAIVDKKSDDRSIDVYYQQYISVSCYYEPVKRYLDIFGSQQVKVLFYEDIVKDINGVIKEIYDFLAVDDTFKAETQKKHNVFLTPKKWYIQKLYASKFVRTLAKELFRENLRKNIKNVFFETEKKPHLDPSLKAKMLNVFKDDIVKTSILLNKDLSHWLK